MTVDNNLNIANMDWEEFVSAVDEGAFSVASGVIQPLILAASPVTSHRHDGESVLSTAALI